MHGLESVLCGDSESKFIVVSVEPGPSLYILDYIAQLYKSHSDSSKFQIHIVSWAYDFSSLRNQSNVILYDFLKKPFTTLGNFIKIYTQNKNPAVKNILIIDDLQTFSINTDKDFGRLKAFFNTLVKTCQIITVLNTDSASAVDLRFFYGQADAVVTLTTEPSGNHFLCNIVKTKYSGKVVHEQTSYDVLNGKICEIAKPKVTGVISNQNGHSVLTSLTTFKLTLEENEKESKSRLHLPYFNAQSTKVPDPHHDMFEDEEDEEI